MHAAKDEPTTNQHENYDGIAQMRLYAVPYACLFAFTAMRTSRNP